MSKAQRAAPDGVFRLYRELWRYGKGKRRTIALMMGLLIGAQSVRLIAPFFAGRAINTLQIQGLSGIGAAAVWLALMFACAPASWALHGIGRVLEGNMALYVRARVSEDLLHRILMLPLSWHETQHSGVTAKRVEQSTHAIFDFTRMQFMYLQNVVRFVGPTVALSLINPIVGMAAVVGLLGIGVTAIAYDRPLMQLAKNENESERHFTSTLVDIAGNIVSVHAMRQGGALLQLVRRRLEAIFVPLRRSIVLNEAKWCGVDLLSQGLCCALLVLYVWLVWTGAGKVAHAQTNAASVALGSVYMVWEYARQATSVASNVASHFQTFTRQRADYAASDAIRGAKMAEWTSATQTQTTTWHRLDIRELNFHHRRVSRDSELQNVSLTLRRGMRYALVGASGSGKTTLLRVLAGLYAPDSVSLLLDDVELPDKRAAAHFLRSNSTLLPQDTQLFAGTIKENLELYNTVSGTSSTRSMGEALQLACTEEFIEPSDAQLKAPVAERGSNYSGGQRQRLALARTVLAAEGSSLLLLDEPTASLDSAIEGRVYEHLFRTFPDVCIVCSVHRLNLLPRFDEVLVLDHGHLLDQGSATDVQARCAPFRALLAANLTADEEPAKGSSAVPTAP